jgi:hypothetical protein
MAAHLKRKSGGHQTPFRSMALTAAGGGLDGERVEVLRQPGAAYQQ